MKKIAFVAAHNQLSGTVRGQQIAEHIGADYNPEKPGEYDILIGIKTWIGPDFECRRVIDVLDSFGLLDVLYKNPRIEIIAYSRHCEQFIRARLPLNPIYYIPQHHCNFERQNRPVREVKVVGYVGCKERLSLDTGILKEALEAAGFEFKTLFTEDISTTREDVCNFLMGIDINLSFYDVLPSKHIPEMKDALKLINAGSFGIPTVAFPELAYTDFQQAFLRVYTLDDVISACNNLRNDEGLYEDVAGNAHFSSTLFHISEIIKQYQQLFDIESSLWEAKPWQSTSPQSATKDAIAI